jgi:peptidyl-prolyl cis-trans isomerase B (cyclophilin B)
MKRLISLILALLASLGALLCTPGCSKTTEEETVPAGETGETIMVQIEMDNGGIIKLELYPDIAPITVANFEKLVKEGFYDGLIFHRVIKNFMIQGGDPTGTGMGGAKENIKGEFKINGINNPLSHKRGVISMARSQRYNSASSQFFICHADATFLDGQYAAFGHVVEGMEVVDRIASVQTDGMDRPRIDMTMEKVTLI